MPDRTHDFLIDLIGVQDDAQGQGGGLEPRLVELLLDRRLARHRPADRHPESRDRPAA